MTDFFSLLDEARRPWLDPDSLKKKFLALSGQAHPDRVHNADKSQKDAAHQRYTEINAAYNCLRDPKERLRHLLELERGSKPGDLQQIPQGLMDMFTQVSQVCRETDSFLAEKEKINSPLIKLQFFERSHLWIEKLTAIQRMLNQWHETLTSDLKANDALWSSPSNRPQVLERLDGLYRLFGYFNRWSAQIQERIARLSF
jgi:curved DNA-binding protein CbpA